ncbi:UNVERIFIED_CONTAM: hypothetical protein Slati_2690900 [Sesamum latifolium]|uniref:Reverse transcriptase domain-containing protein n=1 Tax=Sesamum latifolium TaxID=2727402 RepID=A0AAW2VXE0_9LAMI
MCISTVSYSFLLDGQKFGYLHPQRGLHQGDPLSPYLFLSCAEALSHLISRAEADGELHGVSISWYGPRVSHLLFADDTLIFCQATRDAMRCVNRILKEFEETSGLMVNLEKSSMAFSKNTPVDVWTDLAHVLGVRVVDKHDKYLALPILVGRSKREVFQSIKDKAMPTYVMGCFLIPTTVCWELESMMADFLWHSNDSRKVHWIAWDKMCVPKDEGGLGFRRLGAFNLTMLAKQLWLIISNLNALLSRMLKQKYFPHTDVLQAVAWPGCLFTWRSILAARSVISAGLRWHIGSGGGVRIWKDKWLPRPWTFQPIFGPNVLEEDATDRLVDVAGDWNEALLH